MPEALAVPPPKIAFRIVDHTGQYVLTKGKQGENYLPVERALADATVPDAREDQLWLLEPFGTDFVLRHKSSGRIMFFGDGGGAPVSSVQCCCGSLLVAEANQIADIYYYYSTTTIHNIN